MASLSFAPPGKVPERQYLGDLAGLFERQRRRCNVALTPESFASDLAAHDALRSGLFTLCTAISHMGASDLSSEELLGLIARALGGAGSAEGESGAQIPDSMRDAFLKGYDAWSNREPVVADMDAWPPAAEERKPPMREASMPLDSVESSQAIAAAGSSPVVPGRRTLQEALSMVRKEPSAEPGQRLTGENGEDLGSMTLGELRNFLTDIEHRVSRLGPHLQQLTSAAASAPAPSRTERADSLPDTVIPFPSRRTAGSAESADVLPQSHDFNLDAFVRRRSSAPPAPTMHSAAEETVHASRAEAPDDRPRGIDALLAAAPAWANASPTARTFNEDAFLARHAYLAPSRRPGGDAPASLFHSVTPAAPLAPPIALIVTMPHPPAPELVRETTALIGLDADEYPLLSPLERLQNVVMRLPPRQVFIALAGLTVFAGGLAGFMAFHTLHPTRTVQFKDLQQVHFGVDRALAVTTPDGASAASVPTAPIAPLSDIAARPVPARAAPVQQPNAVGMAKPHALPHRPVVSVWPPVPQYLVRADAAQPAPATVQPSRSATASSAPLSVSTSTMIGYALSTPQPAYPSAQAHGISGSVVVEVIVSRLGDVTSVRAISGPAELRPAAMAAVREWRFRPYLVSGKPSEVTTTLPFYFKGQ